MRLFTGIAIPQDVLDNLRRLLDYLRPTAQVRWSSLYNLHITTKFIGEWPENRLQELIASLETAPDLRAIDISITGVGWFPNPHSPRVLWAGVQASEALARLAATTDEALGELGIEREAKPYKPHLTLARIKESIPLIHLQKAVADLKSADFGHFQATCFHVFRSSPGPAGSIYTQLTNIPLAER